MALHNPFILAHIVVEFQDELKTYTQLRMIALNGWTMCQGSSLRFGVGRMWCRITQLLAEEQQIFAEIFVRPLREIPLSTTLIPGQEIF